jgi:hypothetical protein
MNDPVRVIPLDAFDRDLIVIDQTVENKFTARLRDGVLSGYGLSMEEALMNLSHNLYELSLKVKKESQK